MTSNSVGQPTAFRGCSALRAAHCFSLPVGLLATLLWLAGCGGNASPAAKSTPQSGAPAAGNSPGGSGSGGSGSAPTGGSGGSGSSGGSSGSGGSGANSCTFKAFVTNQTANNVTVIDVASNSVAHTVGVNIDPRSIAVRAPDKAYVANAGSNTVSVVAVPQYQVIGTIAVGSYPTAAVLTPDGKYLYVANENSNSVSVIDTGADQVTATVQVGINPGAIAISPDGAKAYIADEGSIVNSSNPNNGQDDQGDIRVLETSTNKILSTWNVQRPDQMAVSPDGDSVYVITHGRSLSVVSTVTGAITADISLEGSSEDVALSGDGKTAYVTAYGSYGGIGGGGFAGAVFIVDTTTHQASRIDVTQGPEHLALTSDGTAAYIADAESGAVRVFDTSSRSYIDEIKIGNGGTDPYDVAIGCMAQ